ncbi:MAG: exosortase C-terminal domain/associated protein EpsI, partial [Croceibacterium sp.]
ALALVMVLSVGTVLWSRAAQSLSAPLPAQIHLPQVPGWTRVDYAPAVPWHPRAAGADHRLIGRYANAQGQHVDVFVALYAGQGEGREAGAFGEGALVPATDWRWLEPAPGIDGGKGEWLQAQGVHRRLAITFFRSGDLLTGSNVRLKLATLQAGLAMQARPTTMLIVSAEEQGGAAEQAVRAFLQSAGPLNSWMDRFGGMA